MINIMYTVYKYTAEYQKVMYWMILFFCKKYEVTQLVPLIDISTDLACF